MRCHIYPFDAIDATRLAGISTALKVLLVFKIRVFKL